MAGRQKIRWPVQHSSLPCASNPRQRRAKPERVRQGDIEPLNVITISARVVPAKAAIRPA